MTVTNAVLIKSRLLTLVNALWSNINNEQLYLINYY